MKATAPKAEKMSKREATDLKQAERRFARYQQMDAEMRARRRRQYAGSFFWADFSWADVLQWLVNRAHHRS